MSVKEGQQFGSWGPSTLFRHSLFSRSKNTSEAASLPAHGVSEFHSIPLSAARSDLRKPLDLLYIKVMRAHSRTHNDTDAPKKEA